MNPLDGLRASRPSALDPAHDPSRRARDLAMAFSQEPLGAVQESTQGYFRPDAQLRTGPRGKRRTGVSMMLGALATAVIVLALPAVMKNQHHDSVAPPLNSPTQSAARLEVRDLNGKIDIIPPKGLVFSAGNGKKEGGKDGAMEVPRLGNFRKWVAIWNGKKTDLQIRIYSGEVSILHVLTENDISSSLAQTHPVTMPRGEAVARNKKVGTDWHLGLVWQVEPGLIIAVQGANISQKAAVAAAMGVSISP